MQASTVIKYHRAQRIPRGLRIPLKPSLCKNVQKFKDKWFAILNKCLLDLILLIIEELSNILEELSKEIEVLKMEIEKSTTVEDWSEILEGINKPLQQHTQEINERKIRKFRRDTLEYKLGEVYTWAEIYQKRRQNKPYTANTDTSSSSEGSQQRREQGGVRGQGQSSEQGASRSGAQTSTEDNFLGVGQTDREDPGGVEGGNIPKEKEQPQTRTVTAKKDKKRGPH